MWQISKSQLTLLEKQIEASFETRLSKRLTDLFPEEIAQILKPFD
jgi:hypothetical protein